MIAAAFLVDAGEPSAILEHLERYWLDHLDEVDVELDDRALEAAERQLDRAAYRAEQAARRLRAHRRNRGTTVGTP